jgi:hypothetical protein
MTGNKPTLVVITHDTSIIRKKLECFFLSSLLILVPVMIVGRLRLSALKLIFKNVCEVVDSTPRKVATTTQLQFPRIVISLS